ncbi:DUF1501 domain-containing protein [Flavobacteriaceae bacterium]|nr:DUF1501 domain-containing protein [Flavobacteriaceae bacterium]
MERRHFLHNLAHAAAVPTIFSSLAFNSLDFSSNSNLSNTIENGKIIVIIKMDGGNDGLNTVIPLDQMSNLSKARPRVILPENKIVSLNTNDLGLHPSLSDFKSLFNEDRLKIIQNVGYPNPDFSHFRSMDIWQSASDSDEYLNSGWMARYIENKHPAYPEAYPSDAYPHPLAVELGWQSSLLFTGQKSLTSFQARNPTNFLEIINEFDNEYPSDNKGNKLKFIQQIAKQSNVYSKIIKDKYENGKNTVSYGNSNLERQLEIVSQLISGGLKSRIYFVEFGGFDTHDTQVDSSDRTKGQHAALLQELNDAVITFIKNLDASGHSENVLTMTFSEFGRTIVSNETNGTDHGTAAPLFIFGNKVDSSISGANPQIPESVNWEDNLNSEFDFRQVYASIINQWMSGGKKSAKDILFKNFDEIQIIRKDIIDDDNDGVADINDNCPDTPEGSVVDLNGCVLFTLAANNYSIKSVSASCVGSNNGKIEVSAEDTSYTYQVNISGIDTTYSLSADNNHSLIIEDLEVGVYTINFTIDSQEGYIQSFETTITEPAPLQGKAQVDYFSKTAKLKLSGSEVYYIEVNGQMMASNSNDFSAPLKPGKNIIKVTTPLDCQGIYEEVLFMSEKLRYFPNPVQNELNITVPGTDSEINIEIFTDGGANLYRGTHSINGSRTIQLPMSRYKSGLYIVTCSGKTVNESFKIIKN